MDRHYEGVWAYVRFLTRGSGDSEDIVHEAFLIAFERLAAGEEFAGDPGAWLRGTARNLVRAWWRRKHKLPQDIADTLSAVAADAVEGLAAAIGNELRAALEHCLGLLVPQDRDLVARRYEQGLKVTQIADQLKRNTATVRVRLFRIRQALKQCVESRLAGGTAT